MDGNLRQGLIALPLCRCSANCCSAADAPSPGSAADAPSPGSAALPLLLALPLLGQLLLALLDLRQGLLALPLLLRRLLPQRGELQR